MKKPAFLSHFLVLQDLINGMDVKASLERERYYTSRLANIIMNLRDDGILFEEDAKETTLYSWYKPYRMIKNEANIQRAKDVLKRYSSDAVESFYFKAIS